MKNPKVTIALVAMAIAFVLIIGGFTVLFISLIRDSSNSNDFGPSCLSSSPGSSPELIGGQCTEPVSQ